MVEKRDPFGGVAGDRAGIIDPASPLAERPIGPEFVDLPRRVADQTAAVVDPDRLRHPHADHPERRRAERDRLLRCLELQVERHEPLAIVEHLDQDPRRSSMWTASPLPTQALIVIRAAPLSWSVKPDDPLMDDPARAAVTPEGVAVDAVVRGPDRVVVAVALGVVGMPHPGERTTGGAVHRIQERPAERRPEIGAGQLQPSRRNDAWASGNGITCIQGTGRASGRRSFKLDRGWIPGAQRAVFRRQRRPRLPARIISPKRISDTRPWS